MEAPPPVVERLVALPPFPLPHPVHVVVVLERRVGAGRAALVGGGEVPPQHAQGALVGEDMVQHDEQQAFASRPLLDEAHPDERAALEVEALARRAGGGGRPLPVRGHEGGERDGGGRVDDLHHAVSLGPEGRAQDAVARDDRVRRPPQPHGVEPAPHAKGAGEVVGGRERIELVDQPQAPLQVAEEGRLAFRPGRNLRGPRAVPAFRSRMASSSRRVRSPPSGVAMGGSSRGLWAWGWSVLGSRCPADHERPGRTSDADPRGRDVRPRGARPLCPQPLVRAGRAGPRSDPADRRRVRARGPASARGRPPREGNRPVHEREGTGPSRTAPRLGATRRGGGRRVRRDGGRPARAAGRRPPPLHEPGLRGLPHPAAAGGGAPRGNRPRRHAARADPLPARGLSARPPRPPTS